MAQRHSARPPTSNDSTTGSQPPSPPKPSASSEPPSPPIALNPQVEAFISKLRCSPSRRSEIQSQTLSHFRRQRQHSPEKIRRLLLLSLTLFGISDRDRYLNAPLPSFSFDSLFSDIDAHQRHIAWLLYKRPQILDEDLDCTVILLMSSSSPVLFNLMTADLSP